MGITLDDDARRYLALFEDVTGATGRDCVVQTESDEHSPAEQLLIVVARGDMADAIGPGGEHVSRFEERVGADVRLIEEASKPEDFVANALAPAAVYDVEISANDGTVATVEVAEEDRGVAIGTGGETIEAARLLAARHFDIDDIQLADG